MVESRLYMPAPLADGLRVLLVSEGVSAFDVPAHWVVQQGSLDDLEDGKNRWDVVVIDHEVARCSTPRPRPAVTSFLLLVDSYAGDVLSLCFLWGFDTCINRGSSAHELMAVVSPQVDAGAGAIAPPMPDVAADWVTGESKAIVASWRLALRAASSEASVLFTGETGVGKEVFARAIHRLSVRRSGPFVAVNCAALPASLLEAELFGHEKGAFTGAGARRKGRFEMADQGILFLDEIGEIPPEVQVALLRVLQERSFERVGGTETIRVDTRVIAATNRDLRAELARGRFRADLFYRLNVLNIHIPPLRERGADVLLLWESFLKNMAHQTRQSVPESSLEVQRALMRHDWPGNVRELQNAASHAVAMCGGRALSLKDLPDSVTQNEAARVPSARLAGLTLREIEDMAILDAYSTMGTAKGAADLLDISVRKVHYRLKEIHANRSKSSGSEAQPANKPRILLAEDDDDVRDGLIHFLKGAGYHVVAVPSGNELLRHLGGMALFGSELGRPDIIVTDLRMPGVDGMRILEGMRNQPWNTPVVVISAFNDSETRKAALDRGAVAFLSKPLDTAVLEATLRGLRPSDHSVVG